MMIAINHKTNIFKKGECDMSRYEKKNVVSSSNDMNGVCACFLFSCKGSCFAGCKGTATRKSFPVVSKPEGK